MCLEAVFSAFASPPCASWVNYGIILLQFGAVCGILSILFRQRKSDAHFEKGLCAVFSAFCCAGMKPKRKPQTSAIHVWLFFEKREPSEYWGPPILEYHVMLLGSLCISWLLLLMSFI